MMAGPRLGDGLGFDPAFGVEGWDSGDYNDLGFRGCTVGIWGLGFRR